MSCSEFAWADHSTILTTPRVGCRGNPYDNALAESIIECRRPWKSIDAVEFEQANFRQQQSSCHRGLNHKQQSPENPGWFRLC
jgi:hypothetical protein